MILTIDTMMWGQLEADRQRREKEAAAAQQSQYQQPYIDPTVYELCQNTRDTRLNSLTC